MTPRTEAARNLLGLIDDGTDECVWMDAAVLAIEAEAVAAERARIAEAVRRKLSRTLH